jgi:CHAD domain-containing protein
MATQDTIPQPADFDLQTFLAGMLQPNLTRLADCIASLPVDCSVEQIHESRVLMRTLQSQLDTFGPLLKRSITRTATRQLQWLDSLLAPLRNTDVTSELLAGILVTDLTSSHETENFIRLISRELANQRVQHVQALLDQLDEPRGLELQSEMAQIVSEPHIRNRALALSASEQMQLVSRCLRRERKRLLRLAIQAKRHPSRRRLHQVRIQAKQVHYSYEATQAQGAISDVRTITLSRQLHKLLGRHQDAAMVETWLKGMRITSRSCLLERETLLKTLKRSRQKCFSKYERLLSTTGH